MQAARLLQEFHHNHFATCTDVATARLNRNYIMKTLFLFTLFIILLTGSFNQTKAQNTFYVDTWFDHDDLIPGDGNCYTILGECTFRAAIQEANVLPNSGGPDVISFANIPILVRLAVITVQDTLPLITDPVVIDGTTASGEVILNGSDAGEVGNVTGLWLADGSSGSIIRGLSIGNFAFRAIYIDSNDNIVEKNYIGVLQDGTDYGNGHGISIGGNDNRVGGVGNVSVFSDIGRGNVIGFNGSSGITNFGDRNVIRRNFIGMDPSGQNIGNGAEGIFEYTSENTTIGGPLRRYGNRIGFNGTDGIYVHSLTNAITIRNNYIGTDNNGNDRGNSDKGIHIFQSSQHTIGGNKNRGNIIGFNTEGIYLDRTDGNVIQGNHIGVDPDGNHIGNEGTGIYMDWVNGTVNNVIGYAASDSIPPNAPKGNVVAYNDGAGIVMQSAFDDQNAMRGNAIYSNADLGIDLNDDGPTLNDSTDTDNGPNNLQNYPDVIRAFYREGSDEIAIEFSVSSGLNRSTYPLTIDAFLADDPVSGEGKTYLGTLSYTTPDVIDRFEIPATSIAWAPEDVVVLMATDADGNSSEFSPASDSLGGPGSLAVVAIDESARHTDTIYHAPIENRAPTVDTYPNPFNPQTTITIGLPTSSHVRISAHDMLGRQVALLHNGNLSAGITHTFTFNGTGLASGTYLLRVAGGGFVETRRVTLLK